MQRKLILISNDDGVDAPGIKFLAQTVGHLGDIVVVAPDGPRSGMSSAMTVNAALRVMPVDLATEGCKVFSVNGTPVDCVKLAMHNILDRRPDIVLAGVNHGSNAGVNVIYSGTMGAVMEGCMAGIPSVGYSLLSHAMDADFSACAPFIRDITAAVLEKGLPHDVCLNVNFPAKCTIEGMKVVRGARSHWTEEYKQYTDPHGHPFYWLTGSLVNEEPEATDTDLHWLDLKYATVVPITPDQTNVGVIPEIRGML